MTKIVSKDIGMPASGEFRPYRKTTVTAIAGPYDPPVIVHTQEGRVYTQDPCYIALDVEGHPYPIKESVFKATYAEVDNE